MHTTLQTASILASSQGTISAHSWHQLSLLSPGQTTTTAPGAAAAAASTLPKIKAHWDRRAVPSVPPEGNGKAAGQQCLCSLRGCYVRSTLGKEICAVPSFNSLSPSKQLLFSALKQIHMYKLGVGSSECNSGRNQWWTSAAKSGLLERFPQRMESLVFL